MAKNNQKCVRMSDEILGIVEKVKGEGFNEKFENLVVDYKKTIPDREKMVKYLDGQISDKKKELSKIEDRIRGLRNLEFSLDNLRNMILRVDQSASEIPIVSQSPELRPGDPETNEIQKKRK